MSRTSPLMVGLLFLVVSYGSGCGPDRAYEEYLKGNQALEAQAFDQALDHYNRSLALDSTNAEAYLGRGRLHWFSVDYHRAVADLNRAIEHDPDLTWAYYFRGISRLHLSVFEEGIADLTRAITSENLPDDFLVRALHLRGIGYMNLERYHEAISDISACIERDYDSEMPGYYFERARLYEAVGQPKSSISDYESYLALNPEANKRTVEVEQTLIVLREAAE